jgi:hypothetical protein
VRAALRGRAFHEWQVAVWRNATEAWIAEHNAIIDKAPREDVLRK